LISYRAIASLAWCDRSHVKGSTVGTARTCSVLRGSTGSSKIGENGQKTG
jgi:hypothetical protein